MTLKTLSTGSNGNCYILTSDSGKHLILDAGIVLSEIKKGLDFDIGNVDGCIITHGHQDHCRTATWIKAMGIPVFEPYKDVEHKRLKTRLGEFQIESFDVPHHETENRGFLITVDGTTIAYMTDLEYCGWDLSSRNINVLLLEMNYQKSRIEGSTHLEHTVLGHCEEQTAIDIIKANSKYLRTVILCHMSNSGALDRDLAMQHIREQIPAFIEVRWSVPGESVDISEIPF